MTLSRSRRRTLGLLVAGLLLAAGTPGYLARVRPELEGYLLHPAIFSIQATPYLVAAALWLPRRSGPAATAGQWIAAVMLLAAILVHVPMLTGLMPMGGDMVALAFLAVSGVTTLAVIAVTVVAWGFLYMRRRTGANS